MFTAEETFCSIILASQSERRKNILHQIGLDFRQESSQIEEPLPLTDEHPKDYTLRAAMAKAEGVSLCQAGSIVIAADTVVVSEGLILGKPKDPPEAHKMLRRLSNRGHEVYTGLCIMDSITGRRVGATEVTEVWFAALSNSEIEAYVATGEPLDKAGAYAIQGLAALFVREIRGCYFNVVGFPVRLFYELWQELFPGKPLLSKDFCRKGIWDPFFS